MVQLEFHTGIADVMDYSCRLLRKAYKRGTRVVVCGEPERLSRLDVAVVDLRTARVHPTPARARRR